MQHEKVVIIGSGPAGLTAALYTARAQLNPVVIVGNQLGGQVAITHDVENYPGFPEGVGGPELVENMKVQAERFGARMIYGSVTEADFVNGRPFIIKTDAGDEFSAESVIVTSGASARRLGIPGEEEHIGRGVSYCGTCDGFFFRGKDIIVVGGGDSAIEEGLFLTRFADSVTVIHRRDQLRAGATLQKRAFENEKMSFVWDTVVEEITGDGPVSKVRLRNRNTDETYDHETEGVFIFIGHDPNNGPYANQIDMDDEGYIITDKLMRTNIEGVFAAGEIQDPIYRQVATSVGQGTAAAMSLERWMSELEGEEEEHEETTKPA
jgi:thioredoxin reductase (NADPH)